MNVDIIFKDNLSMGEYQIAKPTTFVARRFLCRLEKD